MALAEATLKRQAQILLLRKFCGGGLPGFSPRPQPALAKFSHCGKFLRAFFAKIGTAVGRSVSRVWLSVFGVGFGLIAVCCAAAACASFGAVAVFTSLISLVFVSGAALI
jgi:hypothetical protein